MLATFIKDFAVKLERKVDQCWPKMMTRDSINFLGLHMINHEELGGAMVDLLT